MLDPVQTIPNLAEQFVAVVRHRTAFNPVTRKPVRVPARYFAVSARLARSDLNTEEIVAAPIMWRFIRGFGLQDDQGLPKRDDAWGVDVDVPSDASDVRPHLEN